MNIKKSLRNLKDFLHPNKNENLLIIESVILAILIYYDILFETPTDNNIPLFLVILLIVYFCFLLAFYIIEKQKIAELEFRNRFYIYSQSMFSFFIGILLSTFYFVVNSNETFSYVICMIPLIFLILIAFIQKISLFQIERFLKKFILKEEIWEILDEQTKRDFKQAEANIRSDNIPNAIINISKGIERELKLAIFEPFKLCVKQTANNVDYFKILEPFKSDGSDPRERTYFNFKNYLEGNRHLTFGNIPFFLLNLSDKKIGNHTPLFTKFSEFLRQRFGENYNNVINISRGLFKHDYFTIPGIKISDLRNEAAHPQKDLSDNSKFNRSNEILSIDNYIKLLKVLTINPNLLKLIVDLKREGKKKID